MYVCSKNGIFSHALGLYLLVPGSCLLCTVHRVQLVSTYVELHVQSKIRRYIQNKRITTIISSQIMNYELVVGKLSTYDNSYFNNPYQFGKMPIVFGHESP